MSDSSYKVFSSTLIEYKKTGKYDNMVTKMADLFADDEEKYPLLRSEFHDPLRLNITLFYTGYCLII